MGLVEMVINAIMNDSEIQKKLNQNEVAKKYFDIVKNRDEKEGIALANSIIETYGLTKNDAINQASNGLSQMFGFNSKK